MEKIIVNPLSVRGLGNIVSPKSIEDFEVYNSSLSFEDNVYSLEYSPSVVSVALTVSQSSIRVGESIVLTALVSEDNVPLEDVSVRFTSGNTVLGTETTGNNGEAVLTLSNLSVGSYSIIASYGDSYSSAVSVNVTPLYDGIVLSADDSILSYYDGDSTTLRAQLMDGSSTASVSGVTVEFFNGSTSMGTADTNSSGVATKSYASAGSGDVSFTASVGSLSSETYEVEDCSYWNETEVSRTTTNGSTIYDSDMAVALPTNCEITLEAWSNNSATDGGEHRFFMLPKSQYSSGTTQPQSALYFDLLGQNNANFGKRQSNSSISVGSTFSATRSTYHTVKLVKTGTSISFYFNDDLKATESESWIDNYSDYTFSMMRWGTGGTSKLRNVKIKPL